MTEDGGPDIIQPFKSEAGLGGPPKNSVKPRGREKKGDSDKKKDKSKDNEKKKEKPTDQEKKRKEKPTDPEKKKEKPSIDLGKKRENRRDPEKETPWEPDQKRDEGKKKREKDGGMGRVRPAPDPDWPALRRAVNSIRYLYNRENNRPGILLVDARRLLQAGFTSNTNREEIL